MRLTVTNRGGEEAPLTLLPTLWFRNTWSWGRDSEEHTAKPSVRRAGGGLVAEHPALGSYRLSFAPRAGDADATVLFTENETNSERLFGAPSAGPLRKDGFHEHVVEGKATIYDLWATVLHQLGLDHETLTFRHAGRDFRLTDVHGSVLREVLA